MGSGMDQTPSVGGSQHKACGGFYPMEGTFTRKVLSQLRRGAVGLLALCFLGMAGTASAAVDIMPDRDAIVNTPVVVWGNSDETTGTATISFGDGSPDVMPVFNVNTQSYIATTHTYTAAGIYTASLTVNGITETVEITVFDPATLTTIEHEDVRVNAAIANGLRHLYVNQLSREARFDAGFDIATWQFGSDPYVSLAALAFENHGHTPTSGSIYSPVVQGALNYLFSRLVAIQLGVEPAGDPCVGAISDPCDGLRPSTGPIGYSTAVVLLGIAGSGVPNAVVDRGVANGQTYLEVAQRMANTLGWGQADAGFGQGGWRYGLDDNQSDGSAIGWNVLALIDAAAFGAVLPDASGGSGELDLRGQLEIEIASITDTTPGPGGGGGVGGLGYTTPFSSAPRSGIRLQALSLMGFGINDTTALTTVDGQATVDYINDENDWVSTATFCGQNAKGCLYTMFNNFKALKLYGITTLPAVPRADLDWDQDYQVYLADNQVSPGTTTGGSWGNLSFSCCAGNVIQAETALALLILARTATILPDGELFATVGLSPETETNPVGTDHTVTAFAQSAAGAGIPSVTIDFEVMTGPNAGLMGSGVTDSAGMTTFTYTDTGGPGTDTIQAFIGRNSANELQSNIVEKIWEEPQGEICDIDEDGDVDRVDIGLIARARNTPADPGDPRDPDGNGIIDVNDARQCAVMCTLPRCAEVPQ